MKVFNKNINIVFSNTNLKVKKQNSNYTCPFTNVKIEFEVHDRVDVVSTRGVNFEEVEARLMSSKDYLNSVSQTPNAAVSNVYFNGSLRSLKKSKKKRLNTTFVWKTVNYGVIKLLAIVEDLIIFQHLSLLLKSKLGLFGMGIVDYFLEGNVVKFRLLNYHSFKGFFLADKTANLFNYILILKVSFETEPPAIIFYNFVKTEFDDAKNRLFN